MHAFKSTPCRLARPCPPAPAEAPAAHAVAPTNQRDGEVPDGVTRTVFDSMFGYSNGGFGQSYNSGEGAHSWADRLRDYADQVSRRWGGRPGCVWECIEGCVCTGGEMARARAWQGRARLVGQG